MEGIGVILLVALGYVLGWGMGTQHCENLFKEYRNYIEYIRNRYDNR